MTEYRKEYIEELKESSKLFVDSIEVETGRDLEMLKMIYGFTRAALRENRAGKVVCNHE